MSYETRQRLRDLAALLRRSYPDGITTPEIADELGVTRQTARKDVNRLEAEGYPVIEAGRGYTISPDFGQEILLTPPQAWMLYMPLRRLVRAQLHRNPLVRGLLRKIIEYLHDEMADQLNPDEVEVDPAADRIFCDLVACWKERCLAEITYQSPHNPRETTMKVAPWWFEPAVWTDAFYMVCGRARPDGKTETYTLKLDRVRSVRRLLERFEPPSPGEITEKIERTWGIWIGDEEGRTERVRLRFHPRQLARLRETCWHPQESISIEPGGSVLWEADVSQPLEMLPWIRGWGADVEVLEPQGLRNSLMVESTRLYQLYCLGTPHPKSDEFEPTKVLGERMAADVKRSLPDWMLFIGKWGNTGDGHPLVYHMIDSAAVSDQLWREGLTQASRDQFAHWLDMPVEECGRLLSFWTSLHDLGKATPTFQKKHAPSHAQFLSRGFLFPDLAQGDVLHHSLLSQWILEAFETELHFPSRLFTSFRISIGGHHGIFHAQEDQEETRRRTLNLGDHRWELARLELLKALQSLLNPPIMPAIRLDQTEKNAFFNLLTGFFITSDWISSQDEFFQYETPAPDLTAYWERKAIPRASRAMQKTGWIGWRPDSRILEFSDLFPFPPRPLQQIITRAAERLTEPFLMIVEAPTGSGKTEAALAAADRAIQSGNLRGFYIAMPTQATSDQMFDRTVKFLSSRYHDQSFINIQLAHGNALLNQDFQDTRLSSVEVDHEAGQTEGSVSAMEWFMPRKRTLLAPFGVGTVDQTFISVLRARHSVLRLFGLHRKVVIFDEVHAYDTYMTEIFTHLLAWLRAIGSSVILLSATLPRQTRETLAKAYQDTGVILSEDVAYPRLTINDGKTVSVCSLGEYEDRTIRLGKIPYDPDETSEMCFSGGWLSLLGDQLSDGGCAAVICNTVDRAQQVFCKIRDAGIVVNDDLFLLHAQMPFYMRSQQETRIKQRFGKLERQPEQPRRGIVVATQIIEQSLDLDFDLMISDLAPIDLLIQRIGRLHRHEGSEYAPIRPPKLKTPVCMICQPPAVSESELPVYGNDRWVYDEVFLQRTFFVLGPLQSLRLPSASDDLINRVYSDDPLIECDEQQNQEISKLHNIMVADQESASLKARNHIIGDVDYSNSFSQVAYLQDDDEVGETTRVMTRNIELPTVQLVCLMRKDGLIRLMDGDTPYDPGSAPNRDELMNILRSIVKVSKRDVVQHFIRQPVPEAWRKQPAIRRAFPVIFENGIYKIDERHILVLDPDLGLMVETGE